MSTFINDAVDNNFGSDAEWRAFCVEFEKAILASGFLVAAADTGQIDFATAVRPATGSYAGFKMYKANDALQTTKPLFVKIEFGVASFNNRPKLQTSVGTNTNGSGTVGGQVLGSNSLLNPSGDGSGAAMIFGGGGEFDAWAIIYDGATVSNSCQFHIGRLHDREDGSEVGPISWLTWVAGGNSSPYSNFYYSDSASGWGSISGGMSAFCPDLSVGIHTGGDINTTLLYEWLVYRNAKTLCFPIVAGRASELPFTDPDSSAFPLTVWGGSHNFIPMPWQAGATNRPCLLWE